MRHNAAFEELRRRVVEEPGELDSTVRRAALEDGEVPDDLRAYVRKVIDNAYKVTDSDVQALLAAGYSQDAIFEITVAAAVGAGLRRWDTALRAMER